MQYTKCFGCLSVVKVDDHGLIKWHKGHERFEFNEKTGEYSYHRNTCRAHKQPARWVETGEGAALNAMGRNPKGDCMKCWTNISEGANTDCAQCCHEKRTEND